MADGPTPGPSASPSTSTQACISHIGRRRRGKEKCTFGTRTSVQSRLHKEFIPNLPLPVEDDDFDTISLGCESEISLGSD
jgi:hypothetical protein